MFLSEKSPVLITQLVLEISNHHLSVPGPASTCVPSGVRAQTETPQNMGQFNKRFRSAGTVALWHVRNQTAPKYPQSSGRYTAMMYGSPFMQKNGKAWNIQITKILTGRSFFISFCRNGTISVEQPGNEPQNQRSILLKWGFSLEFGHTELK